MNNFRCPFSEKSLYLCPVVLDSSRDDWDQVEASNRCSPMKGFPFGRLFLFVVESGIINVVRSSAVETLDKETSRLRSR